MDFFSDIINFLQQNVQYAPITMFALLLLAGFNIPVSEDGMIFLAGVLSAKYSEYTFSLFVAVWLGAYFSDIICYFWGRVLGPKLWKIHFFAKAFPKEKIDLMSRYYHKYGILTLILGRFIPFGVRNLLFMTAGLSKMNFIKFALSDFLAATITCSLFFTLYYKFGEDVIEYVKKGNIILFASALTIGLIVWIARRRKTSSQRVDP